MSVLIDCLFISLAAAQLVDLWFNAELDFIKQRRAYVEASRYSNDSFSVQLFSCSYCLSHWAVVVTAILYWIGLSPLVLMLACIRFITLTDSLLPQRVRFQRAVQSGSSPDHRI